MTSDGLSPDVGAKITDEDIAKLRLLVGQPEWHKEPP